MQIKNEPENKSLLLFALFFHPLLSLFTAVDFIHSKFSKFIVNHAAAKSVFEGADTASARRNRLTELLLELLRVNGTPLIDISLDLAPRNSSRYIGVVRVPQRSGLLPRLLRSRREMAVFNRWVRVRGRFVSFSLSRAICV